MACFLKTTRQNGISKVRRGRCFDLLTLNLVLQLSNQAEKVKGAQEAKEEEKAEEAEEAEEAEGAEGAQEAKEAEKAGLSRSLLRRRADIAFKSEDLNERSTQKRDKSRLYKFLETRN